MLDRLKGRRRQMKVSPNHQGWGMGIRLTHSTLKLIPVQKPWMPDGKKGWDS
jgi:hypothetical protein